MSVFVGGRTDRERVRDTGRRVDPERFATGCRTDRELVRGRSSCRS